MAEVRIDGTRILAVIMDNSRTAKQEWHCEGCRKSWYSPKLTTWEECPLCGIPMRTAADKAKSIRKIKVTQVA
jgi:rRNA maturation endonuclease Nob1